VHSYTTGSEGAHSLKPLAEPISVCLHPLHAPKLEGSCDSGSMRQAPPVQLSFDALVRMSELQQHLLRTSYVADTAYEAFCARLLGYVIEERPLSGEAATAGELPYRRATVIALRTLSPLKLLLHTLRYEDGREIEVVMTTRAYRIVGRVPKEQLVTSNSSSADNVGTVADPDARIHTVTITCPDGLPVEFFLENVLSEVRRALRQADPGCAPMTRSVNEDYGWRDRGWERGGAQFERLLGEKLREDGVAAVARRQTKHEAETLVNRLQNTVMVAIDIDKESAHGQADSEDGGERFPLLSRVQGLVAADAARAEHAQWLSATVVDTSPKISLVYDDGSFEADVPQYRVRPVPQPEQSKRLNPLTAIFMTFEQFLSSREERRAEHEMAQRDTMPANLRRTLSAFNLGRVQHVGHVPSEVLELDAPMADAGDSELRAGEPKDGTRNEGGEGGGFGIEPMKLRVRYTLGNGNESPSGDGVIFDEQLTLLHCLQQLRETSPIGHSLVPHELGYHPGVTCDRTGQSPIIGNRYKLKNENYDVCEAEFLKMGETERERYSRISPPCFRKPKGCGPPVWHLWYSIDVSATDCGKGADSCGVSAPSGVCGMGSVGSRIASCGAVGVGNMASCLGSNPNGLPWTAHDVEEGLLASRLEGEQVLRELRRALPAGELLLSESSAKLLAAGSAGHTMAPLSPAQLMSVFREASGVSRAVPTSSATVPHPAVLKELQEELQSCGVLAGGFTEAVLMLWLLAQRLLSRETISGPGNGEVSHSDTSEQVLWQSFMSPRLSAKLQQQLADALAVTSGALPQWTRLLLHRCPALFSSRSRSQWFRSSAFGISRALHWSQEQQVAAVRSAYAEELAALERARLEAEVSNEPQGLSEVVEQLSEIEDRVGRDRLGTLKSDIARVSRERLLCAAEPLMAFHARSRFQLEVQFEGESGFGSGVTQNFYSSVANELLKVSVHLAQPIWLAESAGAAADGFIAHSGELFPQPLPPLASPAVVAAVRARFRFLGRLMAKACRDDFIVPLPLSLNFLHLVRGGILSYDALPTPGTTGGVASGYAAVAAQLSAIDSQGPSVGEAARRKQYEAVADAEFAQTHQRLGTRMSLREWLEAGGCSFVCPLTGAPLCDGGEERDLTVHNLQEYVHLLAQLWLADGVQAQVCAFREGVEEVFSISTLAPFTLGELQTLLCGTMSIQWSEAELQRHLHPTGGYTKHSKVYQLLLDELQRMCNKERREFLNFVTACPHLPPIGLSMLEIEVLPQHNGSMMPTAQTCGNKLYLPEYEDASTLREGLAIAFANADFGGLHERAVL